MTQRNKDRKIEVSKLTGDADGWVFLVSVIENKEKTEHTVSITKDVFERLKAGREPEDLVRDSFIFLLNREPKESILNSFDVLDISKYFSEFEEKIVLKEQ